MPLTCNQVAERYGVTAATVRNWIRKGKLKAYKWGTTYGIKESDLKVFESEANENERCENGTNH